MLPLFHEYRVGHPHFKEHLRVALCMALVAPICAAVLVFFRAISLGNPWLWGTCSAGLSLALSLYSVVMIHRNPLGLSKAGRWLVASSASWFPYFFVIVQSMITSLIVLFVWFSTYSRILVAPTYLHFIITILAMLIPARRFVWASISKKSSTTTDRWNEALRAAWHVLATLFVTRAIIGMTIADIEDATPENVAWQIILWVPSTLYIVFTLIITTEHLYHPQGRRTKSSSPKVLNEQDTGRVDHF